MGLFGGNWASPGPGVDKDAPQKKGLFLYFEIFFRKFWNLIHSNVLYFTASILFLIMLYTFAPIPTNVVESMADTMMTVQLEEKAVKNQANKAEGEKAPETPEEKRESIVANLQVGMRSMFAVGLFALWGCAPMACGYSYITRCYTREQHAWVWSDFKDKVKENFRQSVVVLIVDIAAFFLATFAIPFYYMAYLQTDQLMWLALCSVVCMMLLIYTMMHYYIYQLMVTFRCSLKQIYKNALLLAVAKLPMNLFLTVLVTGLVYLVFIFLSPGVALGLSFFIWLGVVRFPVEFYSARVIQKLILNGVPSKVDSREAER